MSGPAHAADVVFGATPMAQSREELRREHGDMRTTKLLIDRLEWRAASGRDGYLLDGQGWYGGDINKLWLKTEVEGERGRTPEHAEVQALWSRAIDPWFDLQAGVRFDANRGPNRTHLVLGVQGLAPYWYEVDGAVFLSNKGELTARAEAEYDLRITQELILQPLIEVVLSAQDIEELGIGSGLSTAEIGIGLRYLVSQQISPYVGLSYERAFGDTRRFRRAEGEDAASLGVVAGVRIWF
jgi:copper resistance protein B